MASGAYHGLGKAHHAVGKEKQAVRYLLQCLQLVDNVQSLGQDDQDPYTSIYQRLTQTMETVNDENIKIIAERLRRTAGRQGLETADRRYAPPA